METWGLSLFFTARLAGICLAVPFLRPRLVPARLAFAVVAVVALSVSISAPLPQIRSGPVAPLEAGFQTAAELFVGGVLGWGCLLVLGAGSGGADRRASFGIH